MRNLLPVVLAVFFLAACSSSPEASSRTAASAPTLVVETPAVAVATVAGHAALPGSVPLAVTVHPPLIPVEPIQGTGLPSGNTPPASLLQGGQTFISTSLGVSVDYPPDWSVVVRPDGAAFTSPQGLVIHLQRASPGAAGQMCTTLVNAYGLSVNVCGGGASGLYQADFQVVKPDGSVENLQLSTTDQQALGVYKAMLDSLRPG